MNDGVTVDQSGGHDRRAVRRKGPNLFLIFIVAVIAFMFMRRIGSPPPTADRPRPAAQPTGPRGKLGRPPYKFERARNAGSTVVPRATPARDSE